MSGGPVIGIVAGSEAGARSYADAVQRNGGQPWLIVPGHPLSAEETLARTGGLLLSGGADIHPPRYGGASGPERDAGLGPSRDQVELPLVEAALERDMPVLGICRGVQALNVSLGGTLTDDLSGHDSLEEGGGKKSSYHRVYIAPGSKLAAIVGSGGFVRVNSRHRQGIREAQKAPALLASAYSVEDGVIEALESPDHDWVIGVQFHPERRMEVPPQFDKLFQGLVERAGG